MDPLAERLDQLIQTVWQTMLGDQPSARPPQEGSPAGESQGMRACIQISGKEDAALTIECTASLARNMAEEMFGMQPGEAQDDEIQDALGELVNVIGGHVKGFFDTSAALSLPAVTTGAHYRVVMPGSTETCRLDYDYHGEQVRIGLLTRQA